MLLAEEHTDYVLANCSLPVAVHCSEDLGKDMHENEFIIKE